MHGLFDNNDIPLPQEFRRVREVPLGRETRLSVDGGGVLICDPRALRKLSEDVRFNMNGVLDPDGKTCAVCDFEGPWKISWRRAFEFARDNWLAPCGMYLLLTCCGELGFRIEFHESQSECPTSSAQDFCGRVIVKTGELFLIDALCLWDDEAPGLVVPIKSGEYQIVVEQQQGSEYRSVTQSALIHLFPAGSQSDDTSYLGRLEGNVS